MKVVVNNGCTVHVAVKPGVKDGDSVMRPEVKKFGPTSLIDVSDAEGKRLIAAGFVYKYAPPKEAVANETK